MSLKKEMRPNWEQKCNSPKWHFTVLKAIMPRIVGIAA